MPALAVVTRPTDGDADDRDLVAGVRAGDDRAFEVLFQRYQPRIAAYVRGMVRDHGRAEDITQEVFLSALRHMREDGEREILFKPWIYEIARNRCIDAFRRSRNTSEVSFDARDAIGAAEHGRLAEPGATPDSAVEGKVAIDNLCGAFGGLSPVHHDILVLRELDGLSYREIGDRLGMSRPAVESTLFRARKRLSEEYEEIVSGARCLRVQRIVDSCGGSAAGLRDQHRMARHLAHCQPCRRYAGRAGIDPGAVSRPAATAARIAALVPLPAFLRRRGGGDDAGPLLGQGGSAGQWSANVAAVVDPGLASSWAKAVATAATVAVAGMGAGAAFTDRAPLGGAAAAVSPSERTPALGLFAGGPGWAAAERAPAVKRGAIGARPAPAARAPRLRAGGPAGTGRTPAPAAPPATAPASVSQAPALPFESDSGGPAPRGGRETAAPRVPAAPDPVREVGRALGAGAGAGSASASGAGGTDVSALPGGATAPVAGVAGTVDETARAPVAAILVHAPTATAAGDSVHSTVTETIASTTMALNDLG